MAGGWEARQATPGCHCRQDGKTENEYRRKCGRCGQLHGRMCPAFKRKCAVCGFVGHYALMCRKNRNNRVAAVVEEDVMDEDELFVGILNLGSEREWLRKN
ncbi:hypothetical protein evm_008568 [Chilo suppressalis]|nr:hypothetical protein evm_008568 [Chilo suppressalis]